MLAIWATDCWEIAPLCSDRVCPASVDVLDSTPEFVVVAHDAAMIDRVLHHEDNTDENKWLARVLIETLIIKPGWQIKPTLWVTGICDLDATAQGSSQNRKNPWYHCSLGSPTDLRSHGFVGVCTRLSAPIAPQAGSPILSHGQEHSH